MATIHSINNADRAISTFQKKLHAGRIPNACILYMEDGQVQVLYLTNSEYITLRGMMVDGIALLQREEWDE